MKYIPLIFVCLKTFYFFRAKDIYYCRNIIKKLAKQRRESPDQKTVVVVTPVSLYYIIYMISEFFFFIYCILLTFFSNYEIPGLLLLIFLVLETFAMKYKISGTYSYDEVHHFVYPNFYLRNFLFLINSYILLKLHIAIAG